MGVMARFTLARIGTLLACLLLQAALLLAAAPASASPALPCHHHGHGLHADEGPAMARHVAADRRLPSPDSGHHGHCPTCCLGGCTAAWLSPSGCVGVAAAPFRTVRFTPEPTWWSLGQSAPPALPPPRRIA